jgi:hypothetical protein
MKRYFKHEAESDLGVGTAYLEITDGWPSRQIEVYGETWRWADEAHPDYLADQSFEALELGEEHSIPVEEFEQAWSDAHRRCRPSS